MIVLTLEQRNFLMSFISEHRDAYPLWVDIDPTEIKNNLYILPEETLQDECYNQIKALLGDSLNTITIREVAADEYIQLERP